MYFPRAPCSCIAKNEGAGGVSNDEVHRWGEVLGHSPEHQIEGEGELCVYIMITMNDDMVELKQPSTPATVLVSGCEHCRCPRSKS